MDKWMMNYYDDMRRTEVLKGLLEVRKAAYEAELISKEDYERDLHYICKELTKMCG